MPRIKVSIPAHVVFEAHIPVRITDLNYGGHLGNDALLSVLQEARLQLLTHFGYANELEVGGFGLIMADVAIEFKGESFYGDVLSVKMAITDMHKYGFDITYHVLNQQRKEIARAKTGMLCFNYTTRKLASVPEEVKAKFETNA